MAHWTEASKPMKRSCARPRRPTYSIAMAALLAASCVAAGPAAAQSGEAEEIANRLERLQREVQTLQRSVSRAGQGSGFAARAEVRLHEFERLLRGLEQRIETLEIERRREAGRMEKLAADVEFRLQALELGGAPPAAAGQPPAAGDGSNAGSETASSAAPTAQPGGSVTGGTSAPDAPPRPLGTLAVTGKKAGQQRPAAPPPASVLPPGSAREQYDFALSLVLKEQDFARASAAFSAFIANHPKDELTGNAYFWLGRTYFVSKDYESASFAFADGYKKFPRGSKAPESLYNLGLALRYLDKKTEACTAFAQLLDKFPKANRTLKTRVSRQRKRLKCS